MNDNYAVVKQSTMGVTEVVYAQTFDEAVFVRDRLTEHNPDRRDWKIYRDVEDLVDSKFWRWLTRWSDWSEQKARFK